jgi:ethanolamine ammonia-lyase small subunit
MMNEDQQITPNPWQGLRRFTSARLALGRSGDSLPTNALLEFQLDHARARDAVHTPLDVAGIVAALTAHGHQPIVLQSAAPDRNTYLKRPDLGRRLNAESAALLAGYQAPVGGYDAAFVIADGLSALAVHQHAVALLTRTAAALHATGWRLAPVVVVSQSRVALGDQIGYAWGQSGGDADR